MNKKILALLLTLTMGSILQADSDRERGPVENALESPFEFAALPFNQGQYSERHHKEMEEKKTKKSSSRKKSDQNSKTKRSRRRPAEERNEK